MSKKITVIGAGSVGPPPRLRWQCATSPTKSSSSISMRIVRWRGQDIHQGTPLLSEPVNVYAGNYEAAAGSDIVVHTSGVGRKPGRTRMDLVNTNVNIIKSLTPNIVRTCPDATYVIVANPVDILTYVFCKMSGIPEDRVLGSGTLLDTARLLRPYRGISVRFPEERACLRIRRARRDQLCALVHRGSFHH